MMVVYQDVLRATSWKKSKFIATCGALQYYVPKMVIYWKHTTRVVVAQSQISGNDVALKFCVPQLECLLESPSTYDPIATAHKEAKILTLLNGKHNVISLVDYFELSIHRSSVLVLPFIDHVLEFADVIKLDFEHFRFVMQKLLEVCMCFVVI